MTSIIKVSSIMDLDELPPYDILYTDPPWEDRMVKFFLRKLKEATGQTPTFSMDELLAKLGALADPNKPMFVEYSVKGWERVHRHLQDAGHRQGVTIKSTQANGKPFMILAFNTDLIIPSTLQGFDNVTFCVQNTNAQVVCDPFAGLGKTAQAAIKAGAVYKGFEINSDRALKGNRLIAKTSPA